MATNPEALLPPGFRFHPTDEELVVHYLSNQAAFRPCPVSIIAEVDIYKFDPWELPAKAAFGDREWYFFSPRDRKYPNGVRPNRAAASGYWKATGTDKPIVGGGGRECIGVKKALVFYKGRPPKGLKTDWIMHEYRLVESLNHAHGHPHLGRPKRPRDTSMTMRLDDWVLCRIYKKSNNLPGSSPDRDADDSVSVSEDAHFPPAVGAAAAQDGAKLPKSSSLSDLLDDADFSMLTRLLHENPPDVAGPDQLGPLLGLPSLSQPFVLGDNAAGFSLPMLAPVESPAPVVGGCLKRQRVPAAAYGEEGGVALSHPPKKYDSSCNNRGAVVGHVDAAPPQFSMLNQPFPHQQMLLNSRWGL